MISAFLVTRDAGRWLAAVIANLRHFADEVIAVVDAASVDDTLAVAQRCADRAECWPVPGGAAETVRNAAARLCTGDWLWMADDDELIPPTLAALIPTLQADNDDGYTLARKYVTDWEGRWIATPPWWPDYQLRLRSRETWERYPWPQLPHHTAGYNRLIHVPACAGAIWHLKYLWRSQAEREKRMQDYERMWAPAGSTYFRQFALAEEFEWVTVPNDEEAPAEFSEIVTS